MPRDLEFALAEPQFSSQQSLAKPFSQLILDPEAALCGTMSSPLTECHHKQFKPPPALQRILPLFSFSRTCLLWHGGTSKLLALFKALTLKPFKHPPQSMRWLCSFQYLSLCLSLSLSFSPMHIQRTEENSKGLSSMLGNNDDNNNREYLLKTY